jgi:hypothetical protein
LIHDAVTAVIEDEPLGVSTRLGLTESHAAVKHAMGGRQELRGFQNHFYYVFVNHPLGSLCRVLGKIEDINDTSPES